MKYYDITQELFSSNVYPGDKAPAFRRVSQIENGDMCNVTELEMNAHNGTHIDAPAHFLKDGETIEQIPLDKLIGECTVKSFCGEIMPDDIRKLSGKEKILFKGECQLTEEAAEILTECGIHLVGCESQSIALVDAPMKVHLIVLGQKIVILEGLDLSKVSDGEYFLFTAPLKLGGSDGAPCRAVLCDNADTEI